MIQNVKIDCCGLSDRGRVRETNEDQFLIAELGKSMLVRQTSLALEQQERLFGNTQGHLLLVADGLGGHAAGKRASSIATGAVAHYVLNTMPWFFRVDEKYADDVEAELKAAMNRCQTMIQRDVEENPDRIGMGTTLTLAYVLWPRLYLVHVGDTRCYLFRRGKLRRITQDHTVAQQMVDEGSIVAGEIESSQWSHVLWNAVGGASPELNPEVYKLGLEMADTLLLCTDGLTRHLKDAKLESILNNKCSSETACMELVDAANREGGTDNTTAVVVRFLPGAQK